MHPLSRWASPLHNPPDALQGHPCAEMQSNYRYHISSGEEEGVPTKQTEANKPNTQHSKITAHHSNHMNHSSDNQTPPTPVTST